MRLNKSFPNVYFHEVEVTDYPLFAHPPYTLALASKMAEVSELHQLDLLHCHYAIPHSVSAYLAKSMLRPKRLPIVTTLHGTDITLVGSNRSYLPITKFSIEQSDGVTAVSKYLKDATLQTFGVKNEIEVVYNFVNCDVYKAFENHGPREYFAPKGEKILIHISNFRPVKRPTAVLEIFNRVQVKLPSVMLMVGDGPERSAAERFAWDHGIEKKVYFLGKRDNTEDLLGVSDLLLLPSQTETFGLVALEAMACEVPVIVSNVGGLPEVITDGIEGYLVDSADLEQMAERAISILSDDTVRKAMGIRARLSARSRFCSTKIIPQYEEFYRKVISCS